jgi:hypothetical protein
MSSMRDPRMDELESLIIESGVSINALGKAVGVAHTTIAHWLAGENKRTNPNKDWITPALAYLKESIREKQQKFSTQDRNSRQDSTFSGTMETKDSASIVDFESLFRPRNLKALIVNLNDRWSAKSATVKVLVVSALPGAAGLIVQIDEPFHEWNRGTAIFCKETSYPTEGIYLLFESLENEGEYVIGWVDESGKGTPYMSPIGALDPKLWKVAFYPFAAGSGPGDQITEGTWKNDGFRVRRR